MYNYQAVRRGYHHTPSFSLTILTNLATILSLTLVSPALTSVLRNGSISSGRHLGLVKNSSLNRVAGSEGREVCGNGVKRDVERSFEARVASREVSTR